MHAARSGIARYMALISNGLKRDTPLGRLKRI